MQRQSMMLAAIIIAAIGAVGVAAYTLVQPSTLTAALTADTETQSDGCDTQGHRPQYFNCSYQKQLFSELNAKHPMPADFDTKKNLFVERFVEFSTDEFNKNYWQQPEWFANFRKQFLPALRKYIQWDKQLKAGEREKTWTPIWCVGIYPSDFFVQVQNLTEDGHGFDVYTWVRSPAGMYKHVGVGLHPQYPEQSSFEERGFDLGNTTFTQDSGTAQSYFDMNIRPDTFVLEPTWPSFQPGYVKQIKTTVNVSGDTPEGRYVVGWNAHGPQDEEFTEEQYYKHGFNYTDPQKGEFSCGAREYRLFIEVDRQQAT